jgi:hypothetical protein
MNLFGNGSIFNIIKKEYENNLKKLNQSVIEKMKGGKGNPLAFYNSRLYRIFTSSMFKVLNTLNKGKSQQYYNYLNQSAGDYSKRKGGNIAEQMKSHVAFIEDILKKNNNDNLQYSLLGIFTDIYDILQDQKWKSAFKRAFSHVDKSGATNTIVTSFKMMYFALVITFETTGLKLLSFEYDLYTGIEAEKSIANIMETYSSFMKSVAIPMIKIICVCKNIKDPLSLVNELIKDENTANDMKKKAKEAGYPYKPEENGLSVIESFKVDQLDNTLLSKSKSSEAGPLAALIVAAQILSGTAVGGGTTAGAAIAATATVVGGSVLPPVAAAILIFAGVIIILLISVPIARLVIYWVNVKKVDIQKELEMQAELLNNNIVQLQEKLEKTSNKEERARLQNIINKQIDMLVKLQGDIKKYLNDEYEASVDAIQLAEDDDNSPGDSNEGDDDFEVAI